jgi:hypothetical protein
MKVKFASIVFLSILFVLFFLSCATKPNEAPDTEQINLIGTEWERTDPPVDKYILVFIDKSNCMYVYPAAVHKRRYTIKGNTVTIATDTYELEGDTLYYKGIRYFVKIIEE